MRLALLLSLALAACGNPYDKDPNDVIDDDNDGSPADEDCDDHRASVHPDATETCNEIDEDCDGAIDEGVTVAYFPDADGDGYGDPEGQVDTCLPPEGYVVTNTDCDDTSSQIRPSARETCNGLDDNCNGEADEGLELETLFADLDGDGWGDDDNLVEACGPTEGAVERGGDCDDNNPDRYPRAPEQCDGQDQDCDAGVDEGVQPTWFPDADGDGYGTNDGAYVACRGPSGYVNDGGDCDDTNPDIIPEASGACALGTDCLDLQAQGYTTTGTYPIDPDGYASGLEPFDVTCDMQTDGGGWTLVMHVFDLGGSRGFSEDTFITQFGHNRFTDETWSYNASQNRISDGLGAAGLVRLGSQGAVAVSAMDGLWTDLRMTCNVSDNLSLEDAWIQVDGYATTNGNHLLLGATPNGTAYAVDSSLQSMRQSTIWHDNEVDTQNSNHYLCDTLNGLNSTAHGGAPQLAFCYDDHLNNPDTVDQGDTIVGIAFGTREGSDAWSPGFTLECGNMGADALQNEGTLSIWVR
ncbi:MAG: hypothetical protein H6739_16310 [Alphaproteobacteria bacterium]|nr:hypothetical protein [Alphaproteobacteria bacterium]